MDAYQVFAVILANPKSISRILSTRVEWRKLLSDIQWEHVPGCRRVQVSSHVFENSQFPVSFHSEAQPCYTHPQVWYPLHLSTIAVRQPLNIKIAHTWLDAHKPEKVHIRFSPIEAKPASRKSVENSIVIGKQFIARIRLHLPREPHQFLEKSEANTFVPGLSLL